MGTHFIPRSTSVSLCDGSQIRNSQVSSNCKLIFSSLFRFCTVFLQIPSILILFCLNSVWIPQTGHSFVHFVAFASLVTSLFFLILDFVRSSETGPLRGLPWNYIVNFRIFVSFKIFTFSFLGIRFQRCLDPFIHCLRYNNGRFYPLGHDGFWQSFSSLWRCRRKFRFSYYLPFLIFFFLVILFRSDNHLWILRYIRFGGERSRRPCSRLVSYSIASFSRWRHACVPLVFFQMLE